MVRIRVAGGPLRLYAVVLLVLSYPVVAAGQAPLPEASTLVARYQRAIGGAEAYLNYGSMITTGSLTVPAMGLNGDIVSYQMRPNKTMTRVTVTGLGDIVRGFDGTTGWSMNPMEGPRLLEGEELTTMQDMSDMRANLRDPQLLSSMTTVETIEMNGSACHRVKLVWKSGRESTDCFAVDTGLLVGSTLNMVSPMGNIEATVLYDEYRQFGAVKLPVIVREQVMDMEQTYTIKTVEFGNVDPEVFELPAEIKALKR
jgi:hypothetical protein